MMRALLAVALLAGRAAHAQAVDFEIESPELKSVAADFEAGRNPMYCLFGHVNHAARLHVRVDSIAVVSTPAECAGLGLAFVTRIPDRSFLMQVLRGLIDSSPRFVVVTAFYATEMIELEGERFRAPRAFSVVRGIEGTAVRAGQGS